jgi:hypothetical protein
MQSGSDHIEMLGRGHYKKRRVALERYGLRKGWKKKQFLFNGRRSTV